MISFIIVHISYTPCIFWRQYLRLFGEQTNILTEDSEMRETINFKV